MDDLEGTTGWKSGPASRFDFDGAKEGDFLVAFAKADGTTVDRDGHITEPGAMPSKTVPVSDYGHSSWPQKGARLPVGITEIGEDTTTKEAVAQGRFFVETTHGRDAYLTVKGLGELQEWSYGYVVRRAERGKVDGKAIVRLKSLDVRELSPVLVGAGIGTRTVGIKGDDEGPLAGLPFGEDFDRVLVEIDAVVSRSKSLAELRGKEGRELSSATRTRLERLRDAIDALAETRAEVDELLARNGPTDPDAGKAALRLLAQFEQTEARLRGVAVGPTS
jgi:hypothetical protein